MKSGISINWNCNACTFTDEASSTPVGPYSTVDDTPTPTMKQDPHVLTHDLEISLDEGEVTYQLFEKGTQRGKLKLCYAIIQL